LIDKKLTTFAESDLPIELGSNASNGGHYQVLRSQLIYELFMSWWEFSSITSNFTEGRRLRSENRPCGRRDSEIDVIAVCQTRCCV